MKDSQWVKDGVDIMRRVVEHMLQAFGEKPLWIQEYHAGSVQPFTLLRGERQGKVVTVATTVDETGDPVDVHLFFRSEAPVPPVREQPEISLPVDPLSGILPISVPYTSGPKWAETDWEEVLQLFSAVLVTVTLKDGTVYKYAVTKDSVYDTIR